MHPSCDERRVGWCELRLGAASDAQTLLVLGYLTDVDTMRSWTVRAIAVFGVVFVSRYAILRLLRQRDKRIQPIFQEPAMRATPNLGRVAHS